MAEETPTTFQEMYDFFLAGITDDMFMELTAQDTAEMLEEILMALKVKEKALHMADECSLESDDYSAGYFDACMDVVNLF